MRRLYALKLSSLYFLVGCVSVESPKYEILQSDEPFEIRQYAPIIIAETTVDSDFESAGNVGFRRLANYIFGENTSQEKIAMTAPVGQARSGEKIAMTAPVGQTLAPSSNSETAVDSESYVIAFTMPSNYSLASLPKPKDPDVSLRELPARKIAVIKFSGMWSETRYKENLKRLRDWLKSNQLVAQSPPMYARYDPPWTLWFLRRNEIQIEVK
jgi:hypothetical protein